MARRTRRQRDIDVACDEHALTATGPDREAAGQGEGGRVIVIRLGMGRWAG